MRRFESELSDELNVKTVRYLDASTDLVEYRIKPNLRLVGKKYGKLVPKLTAALRELAGDSARAVARAAEERQPARVVVDDQTLELLPDELLIETTSPEGYAVAEGDGMLVALNTTLTPELRREGTARELVRNVQDARKSARLDISDRIALFVAGDASSAEELKAVVTTWGDYIKTETLATDLVLGPAPAEAHTETVDLDEGQITLGVVRR